MDDSKTFKLRIGQRVLLNNEICTITELLDADEILVWIPSEAKRRSARPQDVVPATGHLLKRHELSQIPEPDLDFAESRFDAIRDLVESRVVPRDVATERASALGVSPSTLYRWIRAVRVAGGFTGLLSRGRADLGSSRLSPEVERLMSQMIKDHYLTDNRRTISDLEMYVSQACRERGLKSPHRSTIRNRVIQLPQRLTVAKREGDDIAIQAFDPILGSFPPPQRPFEVIQIDHTKADVELLDTEERLPIGRPWITVAMDVYSRMIVGLYVSLEPPSTMSVGLCLINTALPKDGWLKSLDLEGPWPAYGVPVEVFADNGKEFHSKAVERAGKEFGIKVSWRPVRTPNYGGHIERLMRTLMTKVHSLDGTTFSNPQDRGDYDSQGRAIFVLDEFQRWLIEAVTEYHHKLHTAIGMPPIEKYRRGIIGDGEAPAAGPPSLLRDIQGFRLTFMPFFERTVQNYGVEFEGIEYRAPILNRWINARDPENPKLKRKFTFRYDPRDLSTIWFYDPEVGDFYPIHYRDNRYVSISLWQYRATRRRLLAEGAALVNHEVVFRSFINRQAIERKAKATTKAVRRGLERQKKEQWTLPQLPQEKEPNPVRVIEAKVEKIWEPFKDVGLLNGK